MSRNIFRILLLFFTVLLLALSFGALNGAELPDDALPRGLSEMLSLLSLALAGVLLSYENRAFFMVSSDRLTVTLLYFMIVLSSPGALIFSACHAAALLSLVSLFFMLRFLNDENTGKSDYFLSALLLSCAGALVPQMIWLLIPGLSAALSKGRRIRLQVLLVTAGAVMIPPFYHASYIYVTGEADIVSVFNRWLSCAVHPVFHPDISAIGVFYSLMMAVIIAVTFITALMHFDAVIDTAARKKLRYILSFALTSCLILLLFGGYAGGGPFLMVPAATVSLLFLYTGELSSYGRRWCHLFFMLSLACISVKVYLLIE